LYKDISKLFEEQVEKTPDNIALVMGNEKMTYRELNQKANQLAHILIKYGIKNEDRVAIMTGRSMDTIISIMAVLKAGGTYLPIDVEWPQSRVNNIIEDGKPSILIKRVCEEEEYKNSSLKVISTLDPKIYSDNNNNPNVEINPKDLAYIIFTSGTSGRPKGVMIEHDSIAKRLLWRKKYLGIDGNDAVLQFLSYAFDGYVFSALAPLLTGAKGVILSKWESRDLLKVRDAIRDNRITHMVCVPTFFAQVLNCSKSEDVESLEKVTLAGDRLKKEILDQMTILPKTCQINNEYGPTETTVIATLKTDIKPGQDITIGKAVSGNFVVILNPEGQVCKPGEPGELCVGGECLARGYLNNEELTKAKFVHIDPYGRVYKTGDMVKELPNGELDYLGRVDFQIKIGGYRIEPGEIEKHLLSYPKISDAVVVAKKIGDGADSLFAYLIPRMDGKVENNELLNLLKEKLPEQMIPKHYIFVKEYPLNSIGKVDRNAIANLPLEQAFEDENREIELPSNNIEEDLKTVIAERTGNQKICVKDDFFNVLGMDSLSVIDVSSRLYSLGYTVFVQDFYNNSNIKNLAEHIERRKKEIDLDSDSSNSVEGRIERDIDKNKNFDIGRRERNYNNILLTGATGFFGSHVLDELLKNPNNRVYCILRGNNAKKRLGEVLELYFPGKYSGLMEDNSQPVGLLNMHNKSKRIEIINGDFSKENFGLSREKYEEIGGKIDHVFHAGALVKHYGGYEEFKKINVVGTKNVVDFAMEFGKTLDHISTTSITGTGVVEKGRNTKKILISELELYVGQKFKDNPYIRSKVEGENEVVKGMKKGLQATIYRIGNLTSRYSDGVFQKNIEANLFSNMLKAIIRLKSVPAEILDMKLEFTPVDYAAKAVVSLSRYNRSTSKAFHIFNNQTLTVRDFIKELRNLGVECEVINTTLKSFGEKMLIEKPELKKDIGFFVNQSRIYLMENQAQLISDNTIKQFDYIGFKWPEVDKHYLEKFLSHWRKIGFCDFKDMNKPKKHLDLENKKCKAYFKS
jgi:amino acid adenylation domain-containing protein/thioester reductase-like protein